jgi:hypothetical protein
LVQTTFRREDRDVAVVTGPASPAHDARVSPIVRGATTCARASFHQPATSASKKRTDFHHCEKFRPVWSSRLEGSARRRRRVLYLITRACSYNALLLRSIRSRDFDFDSRTAS